MSHYQTVNPYTGELVRSFREHTNDEVEDALKRADACFRSFGILSDRVAVLKKAAALMMERRETLAKLITLEMGKRIAESRVGIEEFVNKKLVCLPDPTKLASLVA